MGIRFYLGVSCCFGLHCVDFGFVLLLLFCVLGYGLCIFLLGNLRVFLWLSVSIFGCCYIGREVFSCFGYNLCVLFVCFDSKLSRHY